MPDYKNGKIYKLVNTKNDKIYVGSTCARLCDRMAGHRQDLEKGCESPVYQTMREIGSKHFHIALIEDFPCASKIELEAREYHIMRRYIRKGRELLNSIIDGKYSDESKHKMSMAKKGKFGQMHNKFKRGSLIRHDGSCPRWRFHWQDEGKQRSRSFSVSKYGEKEARRMAEKVQKKIYPLRNK